MFTLDQVRGFVAVAEELHFGRAAERLAMTQPPLSRQIQKLEREVGVRLLDRDNRTVELTAAGAAFLADARRLLVLAGGALDEARRVQSGSAGTVRLGFTATAAFGLLTTLLDRIGTAYPDIVVDLVELVSRQQLAGLLAGELDLGLARPPFDGTIFSSRLIHREALLAAVPAGHRLAQLSRPLSAADLVDQPLIIHSPNTARYFSDLITRFIPLADQHVASTVGQILTMLWLVAGGRGIAFVPASARLLGIDGVTYLPIAGLPAEPVELHLVWLTDVRNPALRSVLDCLPPADSGSPDG